MSSFTKHDEEMLEIMMDPVKWAEHHLNIKLRWYQKQILRHPHHRRVLRCGRRIGKTTTMIIHMLWVAFTSNSGQCAEKGATCIVATPYDNQARLIFDELKKFIDKSPILSDSVSSTTRSPYNIQFKNGSVIKLFTAGTRSGAEGGSLRGQKADWLYMDEVDYMTDKDFEAIYSISIEAPLRIGIMVASTPTGRRGMFYKLCTEMKFNQEIEVVVTKDHTYKGSSYSRKDAKGWKEFHFPTMVNPEWDKNMEEELRKMYSQVAYEHEVLADFGTEMIGVFNKDFIDEASSIKYPYLLNRTTNAPICIGVDWDKFGAATQIVVMQWDPMDQKRLSNNLAYGHGRFRLINRVEIAKGDFTYDKAVEEICRLDEVYNPEFIFPDSGAGEYQIEMLRKRLGEKVKRIALGSSYEVRDPQSRVFDKKPMKPFMVNQTTLLLERGMLRIPHPEHDETLYKQMTDYTVVRVATKTGEPTYSDENEHALDAMMLALLAFITEMPQIAETLYQIQVATKVASAGMKFVDPLSSLTSHDAIADNRKRKDWDEPGHPQRRVPLGWSSKKSSPKDKLETWGARGSERSKMPIRKGW